LAPGGNFGEFKNAALPEVAFRRSVTKDVNRHAVAAWLALKRPCVGSLTSLVSNVDEMARALLRDNDDGFERTSRDPIATARIFQGDPIANL
jgi:hypothetical protein